MKLSSSHSQLLESSNFLLIPSHHHRNNNTAVVVTRMLSSHCDNVVLQPYTPPVGRRAAVLLDHRRYRPNVVEVAPSCPRCDSPNTKFCYYNNYSLSQPRYFCKGCRRYWTKGGSLRNVPVGGGCRKSRRGKPVVRAVAVDAAPVAAASCGGAASAAAAFAHRSSSSSPATLRPDLLLDGMVGSPVGLCQPTDADAAENPAAATEGSTIDLALLYAKFLNHQPAAERCAAAAVPESLDALSVSSSGDDVSPIVVPPRDHLPFTTQDGGFGDLSATTASAEPSAAAAAPPQCPDDACAEALVGAFSVDPRCYDSLGLIPDGGDLVLPSTWHLGAKYEPLDPLPEDAMSLQDGLAGDEDDVWSSALACQGLEAALCRP